VSEPIRVGDLVGETWLQVVEAAWERDGLVPSPESPRPPHSGALSFEVGEGS
jgi:hypothetical protein